MAQNVGSNRNPNEIPSIVAEDYRSTVELTSFIQDDKLKISPKDCSAVSIRRLRYSVGRGRKTKEILSGINMTVPEGAIYGLLGPSGSGKTTLLKSVVGQLTPTEGQVEVFGSQPNHPGSQVPGPAIGYMPQELAVYENFTIRETLWYFGRLYKVPVDVINERIEFLLKFLDLPRSERLISSMSGGQKRRVSLASALVHSPPLLILDEPTVGVDPLLRENIWQHLVTLTQTERITVIVTTHYIEEARRANIVGLMRHGKLLAEASPDDLMVKHNSTSLEDVFLKLCVSDSKSQALSPVNINESSLNDNQFANVTRNELALESLQFNGHRVNTKVQEFNSNDSNDYHDNPMPTAWSNNPAGNKHEYKKQSFNQYCDTVSAIIWKNYIRLRRNIPLLLFQFALPAIQVILFCVCVGNDPFDIPVAVVNEETDADPMSSLSGKFLQSVDHHIVKQVNFSDLDSALESVHLGINWGVIHIPENFTMFIHKRMLGLNEMDDITLENSTIKIYPDMTSQPISQTMETVLKKAFSDLSRQSLELLGLNSGLSDPPIRMEAAIYGKTNMNNYLQYMAPGILISISYIMATGLTSFVFIAERKEGLYDRTLAAGVHQIQILISHVIVQMLVMVMQVSFVVLFTFVIYEVPINGPFTGVFLLLLLQGSAGMSYGLMVSTICEEENTAIMMILGTFYPNLLLAGVIWPIEAIPYWLRWFSYLQPQTLPTQALRNMVIRGWEINQPGVWKGFAVSSTWLTIYLAIACLVFKFKR